MREPRKKSRLSMEDEWQGEGTTGSIDTHVDMDMETLQQTRGSLYCNQVAQLPSNRLQRCKLHT